MNSTTEGVEQETTDYYSYFNGLYSYLSIIFLIMLFILILFKWEWDRRRSNNSDRLRDSHYVECHPNVQGISIGIRNTLERDDGGHINHGFDLNQVKTTTTAKSFKKPWNSVHHNETYRFYASFDRRSLPEVPARTSISLSSRDHVYDVPSFRPNI